MKDFRSVVPCYLTTLDRLVDLYIKRRKKYGRAKQNNATCQYSLQTADWQQLQYFELRCKKNPFSSSIRLKMINLVLFLPTIFSFEERALWATFIKNVTSSLKKNQSPQQMSLLGYPVRLSALNMNLSSELFITSTLTCNYVFYAI